MNRLIVSISLCSFFLRVSGCGEYRVVFRYSADEFRCNAIRAPCRVQRMTTYDAHDVARRMSVYLQIELAFAMCRHFRERFNETPVAAELQKHDWELRDDVPFANAKTSLHDQRNDEACSPPPSYHPCGLPGAVVSQSKYRNCFCEK